jgi:hypothetical protein
MVKFCIWFYLDVKLPFGIATNRAGQNFAVILEDMSKLVALSWKETRERVGDLIRVVDFIDVVLVVLARSLRWERFGNLNSYRIIAKEIAELRVVVEVLAWMARDFANSV